MTDQTSPNPNPSPNSNPQFSPSSVPAKRGRGRPARRSLPIPFQNQVFPPPPSQSNELALSNNIEDNSNSKINDISEEIIVINKNATSEALIALSAGFPADSLTEEEIDAGVVSVIGGIEQINYILIRNHILTKWRENVSNWLLKEDFVNLIPSHCGTLLDSAYNYLVSHGYVNFGVAPGIKEKMLVEASKPNVIVIGAGLAGLAAARQLMGFGFKVVVLEGRKRAGGRVYTKKMEAGSKTAAADLGGSVLTGILGNPLGILARQLSYSLHKVRDKCPIYRVDGNPVDPDTDLKVEAAFNKLLDKASQLRQLMGEVSVDISLGAALETFQEVYGDEVNSEEMKLFNWHFANLEYANAGLISKLSLAFWDQDDPYDMGGDHCFLPGGNGRLVQALAENVPIIYEKTVHSIRYGSDGVQVVAGSQIFEGDMALCTVPLGVLKSGSIKFNPELPQRKLDGIKRLGFGLLNKVAMLFPHVFWNTELDTFGHLTDDPSHRGEFFLFYSYATVAGGPLLLALVAGEAAHNFETMPATDAVARVLQILKGIFQPQGIEVPEPIQTVCTRWGTDPFSLGSYSNVAVGASGDDYDILAESVGDGRLFFAGEATTRRYPATMHGAFLTGLREAANMVHHANARALKINVEKGPSKNAQSSATLLADLFREPDLDFGSFSAIFAQRNSDPKSTAILRVTFNGSRKKSNDESKQDQQHSNKLLFQQLQSHFNQQQQIHVYTLLSRQQVHELMEVRGGDEMRMHYLSEKLGVKLVGRRGLGSSADSVIAAIKSERGDRRSTSTSLARKTGILKRRASNAKPGLVRRAKVVRRGNESVPSPNEVGTGKEETAKVVRRSKIPVIRRVETGIHREENPKAVWRGNESESTPPVETGTGIEERAKLVSSGIESTSPSVETGTGIVESALVAWTSNPSTGTNIEERDELARRGNESAPSPAETGSVIEESAIVVSRSNESIPPPLEIGTCIKETENLLWRGNESESSLVNTGTGREEPSSDGRCKRNGKRWRCSREVLPGKIYCEKHFMDAEVRNQKRRKRIKALILVEAPFDGKCKRNGKRWRCSKDVIPGKIYCEKHLMQAEIRNRKRRKVVREQEQKFLVAQQNEVGNTDLISFTPMEDNCGVSHENQIIQNEAITGNLGLQDSLAVVECSNNLSSQSLPTSLSQVPVPSLFEDHDGEASRLSIGADTNVATSDDHHVSKEAVSGVDPEGILMVSPLIEHPGIATEECDGSRIFKEPRDTKYLEEFFQNVASDGDEGEDDSSQGDVSMAEMFNLD